MNKIKVDIHVLCYNEIALIPHAINYWKLFANHVYVYLMKSTNDGSKEYLQKYPEFISIIEIEDNNELDDILLMAIKNSVWKISKGVTDFVCVCDMDECLYSSDIMNELQYMKDNNMTICFPKIYNLCSETNLYDLDKNILLHKQIKGEPYQQFGKKILFDPNKILEINYEPGAHECNPVGEIKYYDKDNIYMFHCKNIGLDYMYNKFKSSRNRLSEINIKNFLGIHYLYSNKKIKNGLIENIKNSIDLSNL